jgi:hypothetical protein
MSRNPAENQRSERGPNWSRVALFSTLLIGVFAAGPACNCDGCDDEPLLPPTVVPACLLDTDCGNDTKAYRFGECRASGCEADSDCCPGSRCRVDFNACIPNQLDPEYQCDEDADCPDPAQRCQEVTLGDRPPLLACTYERCAGDADCGAGRSCYQGVCVKTAPCGGACPSGEVCDVLTGRCAVPPDNSLGCAQDCGEAGLLVLTDPDTMSGEVCCLSQCVCKGLPPIIPSRYGRYSRVALTDSEVLISAYDSEYGDLVVAHHKIDGSFSHVDYVDGVPLSGAVVADPQGARRGIAEPGPDVGTHTSIAVDGSGLARVAYHDVESRALKAAIQQTDGTWSTYVVDSDSGADAVVGQFTDIAVDAQTGTIYISYQAREVSGAPEISGSATGVKLARSRGASPASPNDWDLFWVDARATFDPCEGACGGTQACVLDGDPVCLDTAPACPEACSSSEFCVDVGGTPTCVATAIPPSVKDFPKSRGMYSSITLDGNDAFLSYYDSIDGTVRLATVNSGGGTSSVVIDGDGEDGRRSGDVGRWPSIHATGDGELLIVYEDFNRHEVRAWRGPGSGTGGTYSIVDEGKVSGEPGKHFVGAGAAVAFHDGDPLVVYQDASTLDLKIAESSNDTWTPERVLEDGAHGFYSDMVVRDGTAFIVSVLAELDGRGRENSRVGLTLRTLP